MNVKELTRQWWKLFLAKDLDGTLALMADDVVFRAPGAVLNGRDAIKPFLARYQEDFRDFRQAEVSWVVQGDHAITELTVTAVHNATGKPVVWNSCDHIKAANG